MFICIQMCSDGIESLIWFSFQTLIALYILIHSFIMFAACFLFLSTRMEVTGA